MTIPTLRRSTAYDLINPDTCPLKVIENLGDHESTKAMDAGTVAHSLILENKLPDNLIIVDANDWRGKEAKSAKFEAQEIGGIAMLNKELAQIEAMAAAVRKEPDFQSLMASGGEPEYPIEWVDSGTGVTCACRLDWKPASGGVFFDYKTCASAAPDAFARHAGKYGYWFQAAWYLNGIQNAGLHDSPMMIFVAQEKEPPYITQFYQMDEQDILLGEQLMFRALEIWKTGHETGCWPKYFTGINTASMPIFQRKVLEND